MAITTLLRRLLPFLLLPTACIATETSQVNKELIAGLESAITKTDLTIVVQEKSAKLLANTEEDGWVAEQITAEVIQVISGSGAAEKELFHYIQYTEVDSTNNLSPKPVMVSLCKDADTWYGAGVGTYFSLTPERLAIAKEIANKHHHQPLSRAFCD